ncbi:MAG: putative TIM-barrel fold metal-dependent hydrolase [Halioglobus sp.]|jgi:predicted TIM-barrel fold metal-dependent hydrolase
MAAPIKTNRRTFLQTLGVGAGGMALSSCTNDPEPGRYTQADITLLADQRLQEAKSAGNGPYGKQIYQGYRGLAELPWFDIDGTGNLVCTDERIPYAIDIHCHFGMSVLLAPDVDLNVSTERVKHLLDCDAVDPGCDLNLDIYINGNFDDEALKQLRWSTIAQGLWGSELSETQTIPNLLAEMDAMRVQHALILPIKMGFPFGDSQTERWRDAITTADAGNRLISGLSVHPRSDQRIEQMRSHAASGARVMKLHPTVQKFYPDDPDMMDLYREAEKLGIVIFFHGGRAGIEPESRLRYAMPRHYEAVLANFPNLQVILGHAGARDSEAMLTLALKYDNAWLGIHGQGVTQLDEIIRRTGGERLLFGTDWPFYHIGSSLAKVLICTDTADKRAIRQSILRDNALALFPELNAG